MASAKNQLHLGDIEGEDQPRPMFSASNIKYDLADKTRGVAGGGIGAIHALARQNGLIDAIDRRLHLLKIHRPSHEGATRRFNSAIDLCLGAGFRRVLLRGDTDFTQTKALDD